MNQYNKGNGDFLPDEPPRESTEDEVYAATLGLVRDNPCALVDAIYEAQTLDEVKATLKLIEEDACASLAKTNGENQ